jgi:hypothetical protein
VTKKLADSIGNNAANAKYLHADETDPHLANLSILNF